MAYFIAPPTAVDGTTITSSNGVLSVAAGGVGNTQLGAGIVTTRARAGAANAAESGGITITAGSTLWLPPAQCDGITELATEGAAQRRATIACTLRRFKLRYETNPHTTADTWQLRVNGANVGVALSVPAGTTGIVASATQNVAIAAGDLVALRVVGGATSNATISLLEVEWGPA